MSELSPAPRSSEGGSKVSDLAPPKPRDAATLLLLDRSGGDITVLMGRRHTRHAFMPGKFVFPGGRTDPEDSRVPVSDALHQDEEARLRAGPRGASPARARAIAMSAIRETYEEAGILIGSRGAFSTAKAQWQGFCEHGVQPSLSGLRYVARAITPPGRTRRFDTRFLAIWRDHVALELAEGGPTNELEDLVWVPLDKAREMDIPEITRMVLGDVAQRLESDATLSPGSTVPFYRMVGKTFRRTIF